MPCINTLSGKGTSLNYSINKDDCIVVWGNTTFKFSISECLKFFDRSLNFLKLGASMTSPTPGGFGEFIKNNISGLTPRHASAISAILVNEKYIDFEERGNSIFLRKNKLSAA
jgi:hypothetical protein